MMRSGTAQQYRGGIGRREEKGFGPGVQAKVYKVSEGSDIRIASDVSCVDSFESIVFGVGFMFQLNAWFPSTTSLSTNDTRKLVPHALFVSSFGDFHS